MYYVYILRSQKDGSYYTGSTKNLKRRLQEHNCAGNKFTTANQPYEIAWYCVFKQSNKAVVFEKYLKHGSGFAFARKRLV